MITQILPIRFLRYLFLSDGLVSEKWIPTEAKNLSALLNSTGSVESNEAMPPFSLFRQKFES